MPETTQITLHIYIYIYIQQLHFIVQERPLSNLLFDVSNMTRIWRNCSLTKWRVFATLSEVSIRVWKIISKFCKLKRIFFFRNVENFLKFMVENIFKLC